MTPRDAHLRPIRHVPREFERFTRPYPRSPGDPAPVGRRCPIGRPGTDWATRHRLGDPAPIGRPGTDWAAISRHPIRMGRLTLRNAPRPRVGRVSTLRRGPGDRLARYSVRGAGTDGVSDQIAWPGRLASWISRLATATQATTADEPAPATNAVQTLAPRAPRLPQRDRHEYGDDGGDCQLLLSSGCSLLGPRDSSESSAYGGPTARAAGPLLAV